MKTGKGLVLLVLLKIVSLAVAAAAFGSDHQNSRGREYEQREGPEHECYGTIEQLSEGLIGV